MAGRVARFAPDDAVLREEAVDLAGMSASLGIGEPDEADRKYHRYRSRYAGRGRTNALESLSREKWRERRDRDGGPDGSTTPD